MHAAEQAQENQPTSGKPNTRRRWYQFGLGTIFLLITAAALPGFWWHSVGREYQAEQQAILRCQSVYEVFVDANNFDTSGRFVHFETEWCGPRLFARWQRELPQFNRVIGIFLSNIQADTEVIDALSVFRHLKLLNLESVQGADTVIERVVSRNPGPQLKVMRYPEHE